MTYEQALAMQKQIEKTILPHLNYINNIHRIYESIAPSLSMFEAHMRIAKTINNAIQNNSPFLHTLFEHQTLSQHYLKIAQHIVTPQFEILEKAYPILETMQPIINAQTEILKQMRPSLVTIHHLNLANVLETAQELTNLCEYNYLDVALDNAEINNELTQDEENAIAEMAEIIASPSDDRTNALRTYVNNLKTTDIDISKVIRMILTLLMIIHYAQSLFFPVATRNIEMRNEPSVNSEITIIIPANQAVKIIPVPDEIDGWHRVEYLDEKTNTIYTGWGEIDNFALYIDFVLQDDDELIPPKGETQ